MISIINQYSNKLFGYDLLIVDDSNDFKMMPMGKFIIVFTVANLCFLIYKLNCKFFGYFSKTFRNLPDKEKMFWSLAVVRAIYGLFGSSISIYERYFDTELTVDYSKSKTLISYIAIHSHFGFFIFESMAQIFFDLFFKTFSRALHAHHVIALLGFIFASIYDTGHFFPLSCFILEMSTPFSCICYCLIKSNMSETLLWKINQLVLVYVFHFRTVIEFKLMYELYANWDQVSKIPFICNLNLIFGLVLVGFFLTPYWTYRKTEQLFFKSDWNDDTKKKK